MDLEMISISGKVHVMQLDHIRFAKSPHYHFTRLNPKKKGTLQFCLPALQGIHRHPMQKEFFRSTEGFLRAALTGHQGVL